MKKTIQCLTVIPLTCVMAILPFNPIQKGMDLSTTVTSQFLMSIHTSEFTAAEESSELSDPDLSLATIEDSAVPMAAMPETVSAQSVVPCTIGLLNYYNQADPRWADTLYGPRDPMRTHGCGPTAVAMIVSSFTGQNVTPPDVAAWASSNGYCEPGEGTKHQLIPDALSYYGLTVTSIKDRSVDSILNEINSGKIVIALMNKGHFTNGGHFLLLTQVTEDGKIHIADPADWNNSTISWDPQFILNEVRTRAEGGGPLWSVSMPPEV